MCMRNSRCAPLCLPSQQLLHCDHNLDIPLSETFNVPCDLIRSTCIAHEKDECYSDQVTPKTAKVFRSTFQLLAAIGEALKHVAEHLVARPGESEAVHAALRAAWKAPQTTSIPLHLNISGRGAHRILQLHAEGLNKAVQESCPPSSSLTAARVVTIIQVPPELLFDPYELATSSLPQLGVDLWVAGSVDLEACALQPPSGQLEHCL
jgi:hypothetical protein